MRFRLRSLLICVSAAAVLLAIAVPVYQSYIFDAEADAISNLLDKNVTIVKLRDKTGVYLARIDLSGTKVDDRDVRYVRMLNPFNEVDLTNTSISDAGLKQLHGITTNRVKLSKANHSKAAIEELEQVLPKTSEVILK